MGLTPADLVKRAVVLLVAFRAHRLSEADTPAPEHQFAEARTLVCLVANLVDDGDVLTGLQVAALSHRYGLLDPQGQVCMLSWYHFPHYLRFVPFPGFPLSLAPEKSATEHKVQAPVLFRCPFLGHHGLSGRHPLHPGHRPADGWIP